MLQQLECPEPGPYEQHKLLSVGDPTSYVLGKIKEISDESRLNLSNL